MAFLKCKMCGGELNIEAGSSVAVCEYCNSKQTLPRLDDNRRVQLFDRANHFRRCNEFDKAMGVYEMILSDAKDDSEAYWGIVLCRYGITYVEDPKSGRRLPTINRSQFISVFDDDDYKMAIKYCEPEQKSVYEAEAKSIDNIHKTFLRIAQDETPFDVFICYKETDDFGERTQDSVYAYDIYDALTREGLKVFFARVTLEDKLGAMYEPYIFSALNSARVMIAIGSKREYFDAVWVKNEWSRFLALMKEDNQKTLIPVYKDMSPYDMPEEFTYFQSQDMGKIGYIQDLVRGVRKIVGAEKEPETIVIKRKSGRQQETVEYDRTLKLAFASLESKKWSEARRYAQSAMKVNADKAEPYLCMIMAKNGFRTVEELKKSKKVIYDDESLYDVYIKRCRESERIEIDRKRLVKKRRYTGYKVKGVLLMILSGAILLAMLFFTGLIFGHRSALNAVEVTSQMERNSIISLNLVCFIVALYGVLSAKNKSKPIHSSISLLVAFIAFISSFVCFYKVNTDWGPKKTLEAIEEIYNQGDYEEAFEGCFDGDDYACIGLIFRGIFGDLDLKGNAADFYIMAYKAATKNIQQYINRQDYEGLMAFLETKPYFFNKHLSKIKVAIPDDDIEAYVAEVNKLSSKWPKLATNGYFGSSHDVEFCMALQYDLLHKVAPDLVDTSMIDAVYEKITQIDEYSDQDWSDVLLDLVKYKEVQALYLSDEYICEFMLGTWSNNAKYSYDERYIRFYEKDNGISTKYNGLPHPDKEFTYYDVQDQVYVYLDENSQKVCDVYKFTFDDANTMQCYCYENGQTYTLYRE